VIVQTSALLQLSTVLVAPTSTSGLPSSFRPVIEVAGEETFVMVDHVRAVDVQRFGKHERHLTLDEQHAVDRALRIVLDL
jgi:mRNA interferase MazF